MSTGWSTGSFRWHRAQRPEHWSRRGLSRHWSAAAGDAHGVAAACFPRAPPPRAGALRAPWLPAPPARRYDPRHWRDDPRFATFLDRVNNLEAQDLRAMPWPRLKTMPRQSLDL